MLSKDKELTLDNDVFTVLKDQYKAVLNRTIGNMEMKGSNAAIITIKQSITLDKETKETPDGFADILVPRFKHDISSVMQVKDKVSGEFAGDYQLVWDADEKKYVMREIKDGQINMFDDDEAVDADYQIVEELPEGQKMIPSRVITEEDILGEEDDADYDYDPPEDEEA